MGYPDASRSSLLIDEANAGGPASALQFAALRGLEVRSAPPSQPSTAGAGAFFAFRFAAFDDLPSRERMQLRAAIEAGATLYLRGALAGDRHHLAPVVEASFGAVTIARALAYRFTDHPLVPAVLRGEQAPLDTSMIGASDLSGDAEPFLIARDSAGAEFPVAFACRLGNGAIICDLQPDVNLDTPLIWRLADPAQRCANASALIAADRASGRDFSAKVPFNLTIDDVPLAYDYFNESRLEDFLAHLARRCGGFHLDCAWIPSSRWMSRKYVDILEGHGVGFLWHGIHEHVDHQKIADPDAEMTAGKDAMAANVERYGVRLQPLIIFPYERAHSSAERLLIKEGFLAGAEQPRHDDVPAGAPSYLNYCAGWCAHESGLRFLHRYEADFLTRDRMLAIAALGLPLLAFGHPKDVGLRRLSRFIERGGSYSHFDAVLDFAAAKNLPGRSLEAIARATFESPSAA
ncbi:MAG TPA: hypothetical protein VMT64_15020 [Candidatus Binataceae bacterium]|nr:hypothetical protein [Candidatus Binataceae bacterium]